MASAAVPAHADPGGMSSESSDCSQAAGCGLRGPDGSGVSEASADRTKATTCLQLYPTGQLHSPVENRAGRPAGSEKYAAAS